MAYSAIRFEQPQIVHTASSSEINKLVIQYHVKDLKSYIRGEETEEGAKRSFQQLQSIGLTPYEIAKKTKCRLKDLIFA